MRRVASPSALTCSSVLFARRMKVVGTIAVARTLTTLTPVVASVVIVKKPASEGLVDDVVPIQPLGKLAR